MTGARVLGSDVDQEDSPRRGPHSTRRLDEGLVSQTQDRASDHSSHVRHAADGDRDDDVAYAGAEHCEQRHSKEQTDQALFIEEGYGLHPSMGPIKQLYDQNKVAIICGTGYPSPDRSHFRSMDIWHTAEPEKFVSEGWLGRSTRELDPNKENVVTGVSLILS